MGNSQGDGVASNGERVSKVMYPGGCNFEAFHRHFMSNLTCLLTSGASNDQYQVMG